MGKVGTGQHGEKPVTVELADTEKDLPKSKPVHSMDVMAADLKYNYSPPLSREPTSAQVFMLLLEVQEAWCKDWPLFTQLLTRTRALRFWQCLPC